MLSLQFDKAYNQMLVYRIYDKQMCKYQIVPYEDFLEQYTQIV